MEVTDSSRRIRNETRDDLLMPLGRGVATLMDRVVIGHPAKTFFPELTSVLGMEKSCGEAPSPRVEQPANAESPIEMMELGISMRERLTQPANREAGIVV